MRSAEDAREFWNKPLTVPQKHFTLYTKNHYIVPDDHSTREIVQTIYAMNKGEVICQQNEYLLRFLDKTLLRLIGPNYLNRMRQMISKINSETSVLRPDNIWDGYRSEIAGTTINYDETPEWMDESRGPRLLDDVEPKEIVVEDTSKGITRRLVPRKEKYRN